MLNFDIRPDTEYLERPDNPSIRIWIVGSTTLISPRGGAALQQTTQHIQIQAAWSIYTLYC